MAEDVEFRLSIKDLFSSGLQKMQSIAQNVFGNVEKSIRNTQRSLKDFERPTKINFDTGGLDNARKKMRDLQDDLSKVNKGGISFGKLLGADVLGNLAVRGLGNVKDIAVETLKQGADVERMIAGMSTFVGDAKAKEIYAQLQSQSTKSGVFTATQLLGVERGMLPYKTPEEANKATIALANAVAATGGSDYTFERMGWHMQQMAASGQMQGIQAREFGFAGIPIWKLLANAYYPEMNTAKAQKKLEGMTITYDMVTTALEKAAQAGGLFAGATEKMSNTISAKWNIMKDFWQIGQANLVDSQKENIKKLEDMGIAALSKIPDYVARAEPYFDTIFTNIRDLMPGVKELLSTGWGLIKPIIDFVSSDQVKNLLNNTIDLATAFGQRLMPIVDATAEALKPFADELSEVIKYAKNLVGKDDKDDNYGIDPNFDLGYYLTGEDGKENLKDLKLTFQQRQQWGMAFPQLGNALGWLPAQQTIIPYKSSTWQESLNNLYDVTQSLKNRMGLKSSMPDVSGVSDTADGITGGGQKKIIININREMISGGITINAKEIKDGVDNFEDRVTQVLIRILKSAGAAA
jgi:hypothetical protein